MTVFLALPIQIAIAPPVQAANISPVVQNDWVVNWDVTPTDGLRIYNVTYKGALFLRDARIPGVVVDYLSTSCYFYDQFTSSFIPDTNIFIENLNGTPLASPDQGFQIRAGSPNSTLVPSYYYEQIWRFLPDGRFLALLYLGGGGCYARHVYNPHFKFDFALGGASRSNFYEYTGEGWMPVRLESELTDSSRRDPARNFTNWEIAAGRRAYYFAPFDTPSSTWAHATGLVLRTHQGEIENSEIPGIVNPYIYRGVLVYDNNADGRFELGETVMTSTSPASGTVLVEDPRVKYEDQDGNGKWDRGETVVYDSNDNGMFDGGEQVSMFTSTGTEIHTNFGAALAYDPLLKSTPWESVWRTSITFWYISRHLHDPTIQYELTNPIYTGLIFYPASI